MVLTNYGGDQVLAARRRAPDAGPPPVSVGPIGAGKSTLVETVVTSDTYIDDIERALSPGFQSGLVCVSQATPEGAVEGVAPGSMTCPASRLRKRDEHPVDPVLGLLRSCRQRQCRV